MHGGKKSEPDGMEGTARLEATNVTGAIVVVALLHVARFCACSHGTCSDGRSTTRTSGKCDLEERRGARYDDGPQDGRSGEPGCQVNVREEGKGEKEGQRGRETRERGARCEGSLADPGRLRRER